MTDGVNWFGAMLIIHSIRDLITSGMENSKVKKHYRVFMFISVEFTWSDGEEDFVAGDVTLVR